MNNNTIFNTKRNKRARSGSSDSYKEQYAEYVEGYAFGSEILIAYLEKNTESETEQVNMVKYLSI